MFEHCVADVAEHKNEKDRNRQGTRSVS